MKANGSKLTRIAGTSGEHGRNIGRKSHEHGTDIDIFHFGTALNRTSGTANYLAAQALAEKAAGGDDAAKKALRVWIVDQRLGLKSLAVFEEVSKLFTLRGAPTKTLLPLDWGWSLMQDGQFTAKNGKVVQIDAGSKLGTKIRPLAGHNNHHHITLNPAKLNNKP